MSELDAEVKTRCHAKCRIGVDEFDSYEFLKSFAEELLKSGNKQLIVHARKAILKGLSPAQNRSVPPLQYELVLRLAEEFPQLDIHINGGFKKLDDIVEILEPGKKLRGVMVGRMTASNPWELRDIDRRLYGCPNPGLTRREILDIWGEYGDFISAIDPRANWHILSRPINNIVHDEPLSNKFRQILSTKHEL